MLNIIEKLDALKKEAREFINSDKAAQASAHAGQVISGLSHALENAQWFVESLKPKSPTIVPDDFPADEANKKFGERYGIDWEYQVKAKPVAPATITPVAPVPAAPLAPIVHASDCAVHNEPAMPNGPCDCGAIAAPVSPEPEAPAAQ